MAKLPLVPLTLENKNSTPNITHNGVIIKIESSPPDEANLVLRTTQSEKTSIFNDNLVQELKKDDSAEIIDSKCESNGTKILCIEECRVLEADSEPISLNVIDKNCSFTHIIKKSKLVEDLVSVEQNGVSNRTFSGSLHDDSQEIKINEQNFTLKFPSLWGLTSICGRRPEMEDSVIALVQFLRIPSSMLSDRTNFSSLHQDLIAHVYGVYDGHGGCQVADYCRERMHIVLAEEIGIAKEKWHIESKCEEEWKKVFMKCFRRLDDEVGGYDGDISCNAPVAPIAPDSVGSTAVVAVVCSTHIIVANCGDSRAVLCRGKVPMPLSVDHKPNREDECMRIEAAGGRVINWNGYRVSGFLAVSRSIGDGYLRPYVIADPEIMFVPRTKEDDCLILASDGLWDVVSNEEACDLARRRILLWHKKNGVVLSKERGKEIDPAAQDAADYLSQLALQRGSRDNISVIVIDLKAQRKFRKKT